MIVLQFKINASKTSLLAGQLSIIAYLTNRRKRLGMLNQRIISSNNIIAAVLGLTAPPEKFHYPSIFSKPGRLPLGGSGDEKFQVQ